MPRRPGNKAFARRIGAAIREHRRAKEIKQDELAHLIGCSRTLIGAVETGETVPSVENLFAIADTLDFSLDALRRPIDQVTQREMVATASWKRRARRAEARLKRVAAIVGVSVEDE